MISSFQISPSHISSFTLLIDKSKSQVIVVVSHGDKLEDISTLVKDAFFISNILLDASSAILLLSIILK